jgi:proteic killer suppression protein
MLSNTMDVVFEDRRLALAETENWQKSGVHPELIEPLRTRLHVIRNAPDERTLRNWKSLRFEKLTGDWSGYWSIRIKGGWRLVFRIDTGKAGERRIFIHGVVDYH